MNAKAKAATCIATHLRGWFPIGFVRVPTQAVGAEAVARVAQAIAHHKTRVLDFDLGSFFDSVRHHLLSEKVARRVDLFEKVARRVDDPEVTDAGPKPKRFRLEEMEFRRWLYDELELFNDYRVRHAAPKALSAR
jgi:hypothetical protein